MNTATSTAHINKRTVSFVLPPELPSPKFNFNQRVEAVSGGKQGCVGVIRGLEYLELKAIQHMGFDYEGWSYTIFQDETSESFYSDPYAICDEKDLRAIE